MSRMSCAFRLAPTIGQYSVDAPEGCHVESRDAFTEHCSDMAERVALFAPTWARAHTSAIRGLACTSNFVSTILHTCTASPFLSFCTVKSRTPVECLCSHLPVPFQRHQTTLTIMCYSLITRMPVAARTFVGFMDGISN